MGRTSILPLALLACAVVLAALLEFALLHWMSPLENRVGDFLLRTHAARLQADSGIVIVDIDEKSLAAMADTVGNWVWPRSVHGELVEAIERQHPAAIVFDIMFTDRDIYRPDSDAEFNRVLSRYSNIYFPMVRLDPGADSQGVPLKDFGRVLGVLPGPHARPDARVALSPPAAVSPSNWRLGIINFLEDKSDGVGRRYYVYKPEYGWLLPSLPARVAQDLGFDPPRREDIILGWRGGRYSHPRISYADLYQDASRKHPIRPRDELTGKIVIVGATATGLHDLRATPIDPLHPATEILATALDNLKNRSYLRAAPPHLAPFLSLALTGMLLAGVYWGITRYRRTVGVGGVLLAATAVLLGGSYFAVTRLWLLPVFEPLLFAWAYYFAAALHEYLQARKERERTVQMFNRVLDPRVVDQLVEQGKTPDSFRGERRNVTLLFSDIRNFTTYSEAHHEGEVVDMLNRYFSMQTEVIFRHGGTLDKFIGDCIMAFWGAPVDDPQQSLHAVDAALEMADRLQEFKRELGAGGAAFDVGIGIHTGPAVVGFIGSQRRQDYTAIGDTVNLASRIEGQTKGVARILVSEETRATCEDVFDFIDHGFYKVKGRTQEVHLFEPRRKHP